MASVAVVDDDADLRTLMALRLRASGYEVHPADDGVTGLEVVRAVRPDIVVVDWMMPRMDGLDLCREVRNDPALAQTPIIVVTARTTREDLDTCIEAGADEVVGKPFRLSSLLDGVRKLLEAPRRPEADN